MMFCEKIMELRREKGWSQEDLGNRLAVSRQTVSKWELGQTTPEMNKLIELGNIFEISLDELTDSNAPHSIKKETIYVPIKYYEYKSKRTFLDLPLVHINLGRGLCKAKEIVAIGNMAMGIFSLGLLSLGVFSIGVLSLGLIALASISLGVLSCGGVSIGVIALGGVAIGILSIGGLSVGIYAFGGCAIAKNIAMGGYATGHIAVGDTVRGTIEYATNNNFDDINFVEVKQSILKAFPNTWSFIVKLFTS